MSKVLKLKAAGLWLLILLNVALLPTRVSSSEEISLWNEYIPDGPGPQGDEQTGSDGAITNISWPRLIAHRPDSPNGMAMLVISGGGYGKIEEGNESGPAAEWLRSQGITAFELIYRLPAEGSNSVNVPFEDGQRAMRLIRNMADEYGINVHRVGVMGFSAGGHLAGMLSTQPSEPWYALQDDADNHSAHPNFAALLYPIITMTSLDDNTQSYKHIIGNNDDSKTEAKYSVEQHVTAGVTPPTFLAQANDDPISPVENSHLMYNALQQNNIERELHIFATGGHGWGMGAPGTEETQWPELFKEWAQSAGIWY